MRGYLYFGRLVLPLGGELPQTPTRTESLVGISKNGKSGRPIEFRAFLLLALLLLGLGILRSAIATRLDSFTLDEAYHIASGVSYVRNRDFRLNPEHPPLVKLWVGGVMVATGFTPILCGSSLTSQMNGTSPRNWCTRKTIRTRCKDGRERQCSY